MWKCQCATSSFRAGVGTAINVGMCTREKETGEEEEEEVEVITTTTAAAPLGSSSPEVEVTSSINTYMSLTLLSVSLAYLVQFFSKHLNHVMDMLNLLIG